MGSHHFDYRGLAIARRPIKKITTTEWQAVLSEPNLALEERLEVVPDQLNDRRIEHNRIPIVVWCESQMPAAPYTHLFGLVADQAE